jgi:hypothetical protein
VHRTLSPDAASSRPRRPRVRVMNNSDFAMAEPKYKRLKESRTNSDQNRFRSIRHTPPLCVTSCTCFRWPQLLCLRCACVLAQPRCAPLRNSTEPRCTPTPSCGAMLHPGLTASSHTAVAARRRRRLASCAAEAARSTPASRSQEPPPSPASAFSLARSDLVGKSIITRTTGASLGVATQARAPLRSAALSASSRPAAVAGRRVVDRDGARSSAERAGWRGADAAAVCAAPRG